MENCIHSELLGAANNNNLQYLGYLKIHVDSDNREANDNLLKVQSAEQNSKLFIANTSAVLSNGTKEYNFGTFPTFGETPNKLFPVNVGEYDIYVPKYALRGLTTEFRNVIIDFDLADLAFSNNLVNIHIEGASSANGDIASISGMIGILINFNASPSVSGDINSLKDTILRGYEYIEELHLSINVSLFIGITSVGGTLKTLLDNIAGELTHSQSLELNIFRTSVDVTGTNATTTVVGMHQITFDGQGGYTITPPSA